MLTINMEGELVYDYETSVPEHELHLVRHEAHPVTATAIHDEPVMDGFESIALTADDAMFHVLTEDLTMEEAA